MKKIKPYAEGWEKLSVEQRIERLLEVNSKQIGKRKERFRDFFLNFDASYGSLNRYSLRHLLYDLREQENPYLEYWSDKEKSLIVECVFSMYNATPALLKLKFFNEWKEGYRWN